MGDTSENKPKKHICIALLAHVDAGKTTLSEAMLYSSGSIRTLGRVDHGNTLLDYHAVERTRGITVFSKQAELSIGNYEATLLDTPGHPDFSAETERTISVLDYAVLVISAADGVQGHTRTIWKLLQKYKIPVFLFVNKMDQQGVDRMQILDSIRQSLDERCVDFSDGLTQEVQEEIATYEEGILDSYLQNGEVSLSQIQQAVRDRDIFPCYFGSALQQWGINELCQGLADYLLPKEYTDTFGARIFKVSRDEKGNRLVYLKVTGGTLKVKMPVSEDGKEKIDQIRIYNGSQYRTVQEAESGMVCAVMGLHHMQAGMGIGAEEDVWIPVLEPMMHYKITIPELSDKNKILQILRELEEEEPLLKVDCNSEENEFQLQIMGEVQMEILKTLIAERYGLKAEFGTGHVVYRETIAEQAEGIGTAETQKHYARVCVRLEPLDRGSGMQFGMNLQGSTEELKIRQMIVRYLEDNPQTGILIGAALTDMKITVMWTETNRHHVEMSDFEYGLVLAVQQGLRKAHSILLEPFYSFTMELPTENLGRAMTDIQRMDGVFEGPEQSEAMSILTGTAPAATMNGYQKEFIAYTGGCGKLGLSYGGYRLCHNMQEVLEENPEFFWEETEMDPDPADGSNDVPSSKQQSDGGKYSEEKELQEIFERTYGKQKKSAQKWRKSHEASIQNIKAQNIKTKAVEHLSAGAPRYLLVDGYNIIFAWKELKELAETNLEAARGTLLDILCNYQGFRRINIIVVFDAYQVKGNTGEVSRYHNISVVYTKEAETADTYIEKVTHEIGRKYHVTVATSDGLEQRIIWGNGAMRISAQEFQEEVKRTNEEIRAFLSGDGG